MAEVERVGSVTKAAANLFMGQPNLSKAIKEVENEIGITVFSRSARGVFPTPKGAEFLRYVKAILEQLDNIEAMYKPETADIPCLRLCVPLGDHTAPGFYSFISSENLNGCLSFCSSAQTVEQVAEGECGMGVIRFPVSEEDYYRSLFGDRNLTGKTLREFTHKVLISSENSLGKKKELTRDDLTEQVFVFVKKSPEEDIFRSCRKKISLEGNADIFQAVRSAKNSFALTSAENELPNGIISKKLAGAEVYRDMLIFRSLGKLDRHENKFAEFLLK